MFTVFSQALQASKVNPTFNKDNSLPPFTLEKGKMDFFFLTEISLSIYLKKEMNGGERAIKEESRYWRGIGDGSVDRTAAMDFELAWTWTFSIFFDLPSASSPLLIGIHRSRCV